MSFSIEFTAATKAKAKRFLSSPSPSLPSPVRAFLLDAIDGLPSADEDHPRVISVKASGHLPEGYTSSASTATIEVKVIPLAE